MDQTNANLNTIFDNQEKVVTKTAAYTADVKDDVILVDTATAAAAVTITIPSAAIALDGYEVTIKDSTGSANVYTITIATAGSETVDGAASATITTAYGQVTLVSNGTNLVSKSKNNSRLLTTATATTTYTVANKDIAVIFADATGAAFTITIPSAFIALAGYNLTVVDSGGNANTNNITIATAGSETIDGNASAAISADDGQITVVSNGTNLFTA